ncbi:hypothetical protein [Bacteroides helcogenes]|uniref:Uncharacterized protein n=1 Tax=Bacteroides helcogenes (strain ATCC 35417 / DSM 20613 / JCM 6297 / CCUG 15421 / P 36-108) TaxID=693979 RepID=E6SVW5_BACT6|nr:hypothetical protein [Bacteroides helcogenes]ADV44554.1 hypothetical protein Bache_2598 [Bacteroides helcogenes P 36-108]MDY5238967.1 hypothetical protein [Bacteroides helcogenes]
MKKQFHPYAELGDFLDLLQKSFPQDGERFTNHQICHSLGSMSSSTYADLKKA